MMIRSDIHTFIRKASITILTKENQMTFSLERDNIAMFTTAEFTMPMLDELEQSKIVEVDHYAYEGESGAIKLNKKFGFTEEKYINILIYLIEKYNL